MARLALADVNMPNYDGWSLDRLHNQVEFEADTYKLLEGSAQIPTSKLRYYRHSEQHEAHPTKLPKDISGRGLMIFEMTKGRSHVWRDLNHQQKVYDGPDFKQLEPENHLKIEIY